MLLQQKLDDKFSYHI